VYLCGRGGCGITAVACASGGVDLSMMEKAGREGEIPGEMQINQVPKSLVEHKYHFHLRILSWVSVCCEITLCTGSDTGEGLKTSVSEWPPMSDSIR